MKKTKNIIEIVGIFVAMCLLFLYKKANNVAYERAKRDAEKYCSYYQNTAKWALNQSEKPVAEYLKQNGYKHIAIYGAKEMGELIRKEVNGTDIVIEYYVDRNVEEIGINGIDIYYPEEELPEIDAIIVTPFFYYNSIKSLLETKLKCPIISLSSILDRV